MRGCACGSWWSDGPHRALVWWSHFSLITRHPFLSSACLVVATGGAMEPASTHSPPASQPEDEKQHAFYYTPPAYYALSSHSNSSLAMFNEHHVDYLPHPLHCYIFSSQSGREESGTRDLLYISCSTLRPCSKGCTIQGLLHYYYYYYYPILPSCFKLGPLLILSFVSFPLLYNLVCFTPSGPIVGCVWKMMIMMMDQCIIIIMLLT